MYTCTDVLLIVQQAVSPIAPVNCLTQNTKTFRVNERATAAGRAARREGVRAGGCAGASSPVTRRVTFPGS